MSEVVVNRVRPPVNRENRREYERRYHARNPGMAKHRRAARYAFPIRQRCSVEGCNKLGERHHEDAQKPLEITWLCRKHHNQCHYPQAGER